MEIKTTEKSSLFEDLKDPDIILELLEKDDNWEIWDMEGKVICDDYGYKTVERRGNEVFFNAG